MPSTDHKCCEFLRDTIIHVIYKSMVSRHAYALQIGPFWQDTIEMKNPFCHHILSNSVIQVISFYFFIWFWCFGKCNSAAWRSKQNKAKNHYNPNHVCKVTNMIKPVHVYMYVCFIQQSSFMISYTLTTFLTRGRITHTCVSIQGHHCFR